MRDPSASLSSIRGRLRRAWKKERRFFHSRGLCHLMTWFVALVVVDLLLDWLLDVPGPARLAMAAASLTILVLVFLKRWWSQLRSFDPARVALQVEKVHTELRSLLVSDVQLRRGADPGNASPQLLEAMHLEAERATAPISFGAIVDFGRLRKLGLLALLSVGLFSASVLMARDFYRVFLARMIDPSSKAEYPTRTTILALSGDLTVRRGDPVELRARAGGEIPAAGTLYLRFRDESGPARPWEGVPMPRVEADEAVYAYRMESSSRTFSYRVRLGDAASRVCLVTVVPSPRIVEADVRLEYPEYTGRPAGAAQALNFEALEGTRISWNLLCDRGLTEAEFLREGQEPMALEIDPDDPRRVRFALDARKTFSYRFRWREKANNFRYEGQVYYSVRVTPDRPPRVEIISPEMDEKGTLRKEIRLAFRARDDYGCENAWIVYSLNEGPESRAALDSTGEPDAEPVRWRPADSIASLKEGDVLSWAVEVSDNRRAEAGANLGRSRSLELEILSVDDYLRYIEEKKAEFYSNIQALLDEEIRGSRNVKMLKDETE